MKKAVPPKIRNFPATKQRRMDELLDKNSEGTITAAEKVSLEKLVKEAEALMVANAKRLSEFLKANASVVSANSVPVTVWVTPNSGVPLDDGG